MVAQRVFLPLPHQYLNQFWVCSLKTTALAIYLHLFVAMLAHLTTRTTRVPQWTFLGFLWRQGFGLFWRVSIDPSKIGVCAALCTKKTSCSLCSIFSHNTTCEKLRQRFFLFWHHFRWVSGLWDKLPTLRLGLLNLVLPLVGCVQHNVSLLHRSILTFFYLEDMSLF